MAHTEIIKVKYLADITPLKGYRYGDWIDLRSAVDITLHKGDFAYIPLGVAMELPKGCEAIMAPRSSAAEQFGIIQANSIGIMDESFCGDHDEWKMPVIAIRDTTVHKNDRICQFRVIYHMPLIQFEVVEELGNPDRGGYGTTGRQ